MFADLLSLHDGLRRTSNKRRYPVSYITLNKMCYLQFVEKCFVHDIFSFHHSCISLALMHNPSFFFSSLPNFNYGPLPHEPTNWKFKRLKFCTLYWCLQSFSPAYTDQWSPQPINSPKGWGEREKVCIPHNNRDRSMVKQQSPWRDLVLSWPIPAFILTSAFAKLLNVKIMTLISL